MSTDVDGYGDSTGHESSKDQPDRSDPAYWREALGGEGNASWLLTDPEVAGAIRTSDPAAIYDVLRRRLPSAPSAASREALQSVLANRRHFVGPIRGAPGLSRFNGIGTTCLGAQDRRAGDPTYVTTLFFTLLFLPIWPIRQYLVARAEGGGWYFLGRVPMSRFHRWWRRVVLVAVAFAAFNIGLRVWRDKTHQDVHFVNAIPIPVTVQIGEEEILLGSGAREVRELAKGRYHLEARTKDGDLVEELEVEVPGDCDCVAYNVLGAAPLLYAEITYTPRGAQLVGNSVEPVVRQMAGRSWRMVDGVDYPFEVPPQTLQASSQSAGLRRTQVMVEDGGWERGLQNLATYGEPEQAAAIARKIALLLPDDERAVWSAFQYAMAANDPAVAKAFIDDLLAAAPESIQAHRVRQEFSQQHGDVETLRGEYRAAFERNPDDAQAAYLYARILEFDEAQPILEKALGAHPESPWLLRALSWLHQQQGAFAEAEGLYRRLLELFPGDTSWLQMQVVRAQAGQGRHADALATLAAYLNGAPARASRGEDPIAPGLAWDMMRLYTRLKVIAPGAEGYPTPRQMWTRFGGPAPPDHVLAVAAAHAGDQPGFAALRKFVTEPSLLAQCDITLLAQSDLEAAVRMALEQPEEVRAQLGDAVQLILACELSRRGEQEKAEALFAGLSPHTKGQLDFEDVQALPDVGGLNEDLDIELWAVMLAAAARREEDPARRAALLQDARHFDVLDQWVRPADE